MDLANALHSAVTTRDAVLRGKRVSAFSGKALLKAIMKSPQPPPDRTAGVSIATKLLADGFCTRCQIDQSQIARSGPVRLQRLVPGLQFEEGFFYIWTFEPKRSWGFSLLLLLVVIALALVKIWPLWMKICVWWMSVVTLVGILGVLILRVVLWVCMYPIPRLSGLWLFPNIIDDEHNKAFLDAFRPLFGRGHGKKQKEQPEMTWGTSALWNGIALCLLGAVIAYRFGLFNQKLIPSFVLTKQQKESLYLLEDHQAANETNEES